MPFLTVNGLTVQVRKDSWSESNDDVQTTGRAVNGTYFRDVVAYKRGWTGETPILTGTTAAALRDWIKGRGDYASFESSTRTSRGLTPSGTGTANTSTSEKKFGTRSLLISSGGTAAYAFGSGYASRWTVCVWKRTASNVFTHYAIDDAGTQYKAGAVHTPSGSDSVANWLTSSSGTFTLLGKDIAGTNSASAYYDELVVVPYRMTSTQIAALAARTAALSSVPSAVLVGGDCVGGTEIACIGTVSTLNNNPTGADATKASVSFEFSEV